MPVAEAYIAADTAIPKPVPIPSVIVAPPFALDIVMVSPELVPFAKTGGLADVVSSLAAALRSLGHRVRLMVPAYRGVLDGGIARETGIRFGVPIGGGSKEAALLTAETEFGVPVHFIRSDRYFDRPFLYGTPEGDYPDNAERFIFFSRAVLEALRHLGTPHILHAHDWQAALTIAFLKAQPELYPALSAVRTVLTVHNVGYQGLFPPQDWELTDLDPGLFTFRHLEFYGKINFLKGGLAFADKISTVSPTHSREIQTPEYGFGLDGFFRARAGTVTGILNGADYRIWSPRNDQLIPKNYNPEDLTGKEICKASLQKSFGLAEEPEIPLIGIVSRLVPQKGFDLLEAVFNDLVRRDVQIVLLGTGEKRYEEFFEAAAPRYPKIVSVHLGFDDRLAHWIEAGSDMFLMPSLYEPSGLNQLYSLKYGTIPIVRATGGLKDSVEEFDPATGKGNGFVFHEYSGAALLAAIDRALTTFQRKDQWTQLMKAAMTADYSWDRSAREYVELYRSLWGSAMRCPVDL
jgi:starch synthase